jgi:hypothetical protein
LSSPMKVKKARETSTWNENPTDFAILCSPEGLQKVVTIATRSGRGDKQQFMLLNRLITIPLAVADRYKTHGGHVVVQLLICHGDADSTPRKGEVSFTRAWPSLEQKYRLKVSVGEGAKQQWSFFWKPEAVPRLEGSAKDPFRVSADAVESRVWTGGVWRYHIDPNIYLTACK